MDATVDHDEAPVSCLSSSKLDKQLRRQVKRVTSAAVMLMQVVSPTLAKKKFNNEVCETGPTLPERTAVDMEATPAVERIVQCVIRHQENRMLSPVTESHSPDLDFGTDYSLKGSYRHCSQADQCHHPSVCLQPTMDIFPEEPVVLGERKTRARNRVRSMSMSVICNKSNVEDCHMDPLMCVDENGGKAVGKDQRKGGKRNPLRQIGNILGCFLGIKHDNREKKSWEKRSQALALLELSQRQQDALAMKQDTIELLEWKLEQLQLLSSSAGGHVSPQQYPGGSFRSSQNHNPLAPIADYPPDLQNVPPNVLQGTFSKRYAEEELLGKSRHDRLFSPHDPYIELKLEKAELESAILHLFDMTTVKARLAVRYFCKIFMKQMEISGYSVWRTLAEVEPNTKFQKKEHTAFTLESRLNKALYHSFENDSFDETGITKIIDPEKRCMIRFGDFQRLKLVDAANAVNPQHVDFDHEFWTFSENKMREMWFLFPWNVVFKDSDERSTFTAAFLDAAKCVWLLHRLAFAVYPNVTILRVGKGMHANSQYVEQVTPIEGKCRRCEGPKIEFMTMPGFQTRKKIIKCQVYRHLQCT
ncbi:unnamed protein product [Calypogeia fissa]